MKTYRRRGIVGVILLLGGLCAGCIGPRPVATVLRLEPPPSPGQAHHVIVQIENRGSGSGQAEVTVRLRDTRGVTVGQNQIEVELRAGETVTTAIPITPGAAGPYTPEADARYPPE